MMDIKNKVVIVTGGTGGIGFATIQALLKHGAKHVAMLDVEATKNRAANCVQTVEKEFGKNRTTFYTCDVTKPEQFKGVYDSVLKAQKNVDVLINNAGILSDVQGSTMIDVNLKGVINCTLEAIERMGKHNNGKGGTILNVASVVGLQTFPALPIYNATKYGVYGFTRSLKEHNEYIGVRTLAICPGVTQTNFLERNWREESLKFVQDKFLDELLHCSDVIQPPENVASAIVKMLKEAKPGATWVVDDNEPPYEVADPQPYKDRKIAV